ncbi:MAG TPA: hypothetical protein VJU79_02485 [Candidatus Dormibacteraeota bacterium]|nr:hypothetical protein [Candidatus Dormibacteraeota bacterium]
MRRWLPLLALVVVFVVLRVPSLVEPVQFSDEGTYADIGWALDHGAVLYRDVWDNKPPGVYWLASGIAALSPSVIAFHVAASIVTALTAVVVWLLARRLASGAVAWVATFAFVVVASLPTLAGDVFNAEAVGALFAATAVLFLLKGRPIRSVLAGVLVLAAVLCKATFAADAVVVLTLPLLIAYARRDSMRHGFGQAGWTLLGFALTAAAATGVLAATGSLSGFADTLLHQDLTYLQQVGVGGVVSAAPPSGGVALTAFTASRTVLVVAAGGLVAGWFARRRALSGAALAWWLAWDLGAVMLSARGLVQYVQQLEPVLCVSVAMMVASLLRRTPKLWLQVPLAGAIAWAACIAALLIPMAEVSLVQPQSLGAAASSDVSPKAIGHYLLRGWERALGVISLSKYEAGFGSEPAVVSSTVDCFRTHSTEGQRVFVWGRVPWAYALSGRLPAGQYVTLNAAYIVDPGAEPRLISQLQAHRPVVMVVQGSAPPALDQLLHTSGYRGPIERAANPYCWLSPEAH